MLAVEWFRVPLLIGAEILLGSGLVVSATGIGWVFGRRRSLPPVRAVWWWMHAVVLPLVSSRSWRQRASLIFFNNSLVLAAFVAAGVWAVCPWPWGTLAAVALVAATFLITSQLWIPSALCCKAHDRVVS